MSVRLCVCKCGPLDTFGMEVVYVIISVQNPSTTFDYYILVLPHCIDTV